MILSKRAGIGGVAGITGGVAIAAAVGLASAGNPVPAQASAMAGEFGVDGMHSSVVFNVSYMGTTDFWGRFNDVSGSFSFDKSNPSASSLSIEIDSSSVDTRNDGRDKHLRGGDFFSAREFPNLSFVADSFKSGSNGQLIAEGDLTMRGVTERISVPITLGETKTDPRANKPRSGFTTEFTIQRSKFGVSYGIEGGVLGDDVTVHVGITGIQN